MTSANSPGMADRSGPRSPAGPARPSPRRRKYRRVPGRREQQRRPQRVHVAGHRRLPGVPGLLGQPYTPGCRPRRARWSGPSARPPGPPRSRSPAAVRRDQHVRRLSGPGCTSPARGSRRALGAPAASQRTVAPAAARRPAPAGPATRPARTPWPARAGRPPDRPPPPRREHPLTFLAAATSCAKPGPEAGLLGQLHPDRLDRDQPAGRRTAQYTWPSTPSPAAETTYGPIRSGSHLRSVSSRGAHGPAATPSRPPSPPFASARPPNSGQHPSAEPFAQRAASSPRSCDG